MRNRTIYYLIACGVLICIQLASCNKFLEEKPNSKLATIVDVKQAQAILDDHRLINDAMPSLGTASSDEAYFRQTEYNTSSEFERAIYRWSDSGLYRPASHEWGTVYSNIYKCNVVISTLNDLTNSKGSDSSINATRSHALFLRGVYFLSLAQIWCNAYDPSSAVTDLGLPLRTDPDIESAVGRSNLKQTFDQILSDLKESSRNLPLAPVHEVRPSKGAAYAYLARAYLYMREYDSAGHYAQLSLNLKSDLYDYNEVPNPSASFPFAPKHSHPETIIEFGTTGPPNLLNASFGRIDSSLFLLFDDNDWRKALYFRMDPDGAARFKGSLIGSNVLFEGPTVAEMMLIRAECLARRGDAFAVSESTNILNSLLEKRYKTGTFDALEFDNSNDLLAAVLVERRKELLLRGQRWGDIKRLNKEGSNIIQKRIVNNELIILEPNSKKYARPIPTDVVLFGVAQNP